MGKRLKDKKITIYSYVEVSEPGHMLQKKLKPIHPGKLWAYVRQLSVTEFYVARAQQQQESILFVVNWRPDITTECLIEYKGKYYGIIRIDTFEGYKGDLQLYADEPKGGHMPNTDSMLPYE